MANRVTWDDNLGNVFDNMVDAVGGVSDLVADVFEGAVSKAKNALDTFFAVCNTNSSLGTTNEQVLTEIANSPHWVVSNADGQEREAGQAVQAVDKVSKQIDASASFEGETAEKAIEYGKNIVNLKYDETLAEQTSTMNDIANRANSVIDYVRNHRDGLPGSKLDQQSTDMLNGVRNVVVHIPVLNKIIDTAGWSNPVEKINMYLANNREKAAGDLLDDVKEQFRQAVGGDLRPVALPEPESTGGSPIPIPIPVPDPDPDDNTGDDGRVPGPGTYLGGGAYDLNGDGDPDYYDYNLDGVPDVWVDSDGDGIPDIYDTYDDNDPQQRKTIEDATEQVKQNIANNHRNNGGGSDNGGNSGDSGNGSGNNWNNSNDSNGGDSQDFDIDGGNTGYYEPIPGPPDPPTPTPDPYDTYNPYNPPTYDPYNPPSSELRPKSWTWFIKGYQTGLWGTCPGIPP
ncbi:hypothetical protein ACFPID_05575, partial [Bifidobacterium leontopitheci]